MRGLVGIWGHPFLDLEPWISTQEFGSIDEEVCQALVQVETVYTGGSHHTMGIVPPSFQNDGYIDYGQVLKSLTAEQTETFLSLADEERRCGSQSSAAESYGEEKDHPLSLRQMLYLKYRFGVYFPWKVYYELIPNLYWNEKSSGRGKSFTEEAKRLFPKTVAFVESLPFRELGSCKLLGLEANDFGTVHRDGDPEEKRTVDNFITFCPRGNKRLFVWSEEEKLKVEPKSRVYWFNDSDYHGVEADPYFRYSLRVDGVFEERFLEQLRETYMPGLDS